MGCGASSSATSDAANEQHRSRSAMHKYKEGRGTAKSASTGEGADGGGTGGGELWKDPTIKPCMSASQRGEMLRVYASTFRTVRYILATIGRIKSTMKKWVVEARNRIRERKQREERARQEAQQQQQQQQQVEVTPLAGGEVLGEQGANDATPSGGVAGDQHNPSTDVATPGAVNGESSEHDADAPPNDDELEKTEEDGPVVVEADGSLRRCASTPFQTATEGGSSVEEGGTSALLPLYINAVVSLDADGNAHEPQHGKHRRSVMSVPELDAIISRKQSRVDYISAGSLLIAQRMAHLGLVQHAMEDDGNCQFRAIAHQIFNDAEQHGLVRTVICKFMRGRKHEEYDFLFENEEECDDYLSLMETEGTFGDELTLRAACDTFGIVMHLITSEEQDYYVKYVPNFAAVGVDEDAYFDTLDVFLAFVHPVHYNSIVTKS